MLRNVPVNRDHPGTSGAGLGQHGLGKASGLPGDALGRTIAAVEKAGNVQKGGFTGQPFESARAGGMGVRAGGKENSGEVRAKRRLELESGTAEARAKRASGGQWTGELPALEPFL